MTMTEKQIWVISFTVITLLGLVIILPYWISEGEAFTGLLYSSFFVFIMLCLHGGAYLLHKNQMQQKAGQSDSHESEEEIMLLMPALRSAVIQHLFFLILTSLILDGGFILQVCRIAILAHWGGIIMLIARMKLKYTQSDIQFIRFAFFPILSLALFLAHTPLVGCLAK